MPWSVLYLAVFGSLIGSAYYYLVKTKGATAVNMVTLATPLLALFLGDWLNGEELAWRTPEQNLSALGR